jgi:hypothetical protein
MMRLHFVDSLPVLGYREVDGRDLAFAWVWHQACLRVTFVRSEPSLIGRVVHLDASPRLVAAPDNLDWLGQDDPARTLAVIDLATDVWHRRQAVTEAVTVESGVSVGVRSSVVHTVLVERAMGEA